MTTQAGPLTIAAAARAAGLPESELAGAIADAAAEAERPTARS